MRFVDELRAALGRDAVIDDPARIEPYVTDWRGVFKGSAVAVVRPSTAQEVALVLQTCTRARIAVVPQGGNTGLAAGATPLERHESIVLSLSRMNAIREIDAPGFTMAVDAGCVLADVRAAATAAKRLFPLSLAAEGSAQIGGLISTNAGGSAVLRYGSMRSLVLGLEAVLSDGTILHGMRALRKDNAGYDWKQFFIGAEGTLGVVTGAVLRLFPQPNHTKTALIGAASVENAIAIFMQLQSLLGETLTAFEFFPDRAVALRAAHENVRRPMIEHPWYVLVESASALPLDQPFEAALQTIVDDGVSDDVVVAASSAQSRELWAWRESISEHERRAGRSVKHDVSVAISSLPAFIADATAEVEKAFPGASALPFGHIGDGNVHFNVLLPIAPVYDAELIAARVHRIVSRYHGSITAEHGIGRYRRDDLRVVRSGAEIEVMRAVKRAFDAAGILNPGAIFPA